MVDRLDEVLQECIELLRGGASVEECLARYPEQANDLTPLLRATLAAQRQLNPGLPRRTRARLKVRVLQEWDRRHPAQRRLPCGDT